LALLADLDLAQYHLYHAARGDLLARSGRPADAKAAYDDALALVTNRAERDLLAQRRDALA
jgi:RNA polymerase sigma-70 factor, ECF subfamily